MMLLAELQPGDQAQILGFAPGDTVYRHKLLAMGLTPGAQFTVVRRAPFGDPIQICVRNFQLALRQPEANLIQVERIDAK